MAKKKQVSAEVTPEQTAHITEAVTAVISPAVADAGLYLEDVKLVGAGSSRALRITLDLPEDELGAIDLDRLGEVSRAISTALDTHDVVPGAYNLEVSTPGATRPLTELRHFKRARGRLMRIELNDGAMLSGRLTRVSPNGDTLELELPDGSVKQVPVSEIRKGKVELEMSRVDAAIFDDDDDDDLADNDDLTVADDLQDDDDDNDENGEN